MKQYLEILNAIVETGYNVAPAKRQDIGTKQINSWQFQHDLREGFPLLTTKQMFTKGIIAELLWFLSGETNIKPLVDAEVNIWNKDAYNYYLRKAEDFGTEPFHKTIDSFVSAIKDKQTPTEADGYVYRNGDLGKVYSKQWRNFNGVDQIAKLIEDIKNAISTGYNDRRLIVSAWNPAELPEMALPPCHWAFEIILEPIELGNRNQYQIAQNDYQSFYTHDELDRNNIPKYYINLKWHQRSCDTFLGIPFNIASYAFLAHMIAQQTGTIAKTLIGDLSRVHIYYNHKEQVLQQLERTPTALPKLELKKAKDIFSYTPEDFKIVGYNPQSPIKAEMVG